MNIETRKYKLKGISPILGSTPMNKDTYFKYIASKAKIEEEKIRSLEDIQGVVDVDGKITGFFRNPSNNEISLKGYQIKGFLKDAAKALKSQLNMASTTSKIDNFVFIQENFIPIVKNGINLKETDGYLERPIRGETPQGPRVALAKSEIINEGWEVEITIKVLENKGTAKSVAIDFGIIEELLSYGELKGLLQWRNGGYGSFTFERIE